MSSFVIDTSSVQLGQVTRINITDQGIFRVFYNDICGNMYCALSRESNYNQVIYQSNANRTIMNNSGMNAPFYGGTYHENELKYMDNSSNFYIYRYPTMGEEMDLCACDRGPISYFTEIQLQKYIKQGDSSGEIYTTSGAEGLVTINNYAHLRAGGNVLAYDYNWYEQVAFGYCTSEKGGYALDPSQAAIIATENGLALGGNGTNFKGAFGTSGLYAYPSTDASYPNMAFYGTTATDYASRKRATTSPVYRPGVPASTTMAMYVPDVIYLPYNAETFETRGLKLKNKPLNDASLFQYVALNGANSRYITEPWETDVSNNPASGPSSLNVKYYIASKRPQYTWLDSNNYPINPWTNDSQIEETDKYYKGRWAIYVDVKNTVRNPSAPDSFIGNDTSGNIYISRSNRAHKPVYTYCLENHFKNGVTGEPDLSMNDISNVYVDLDLDISTNAINPNFNNIYARPYFIMGSDASTNVIIGRAAFDLSGSDVNTLITPTEDSISLEKYYFDLTLAHQGGAGVGLKYCKIKVNSNGNQYWDSAPYTRWHAVYQVKHKSDQAKDCLHYHSGKFEPTGLMFDISYNLTFKQCQGLFPSMDLDLSANSAGGGIPYVAYFSGKDCPTALDRSIYLMHGNPNSSNDPLEESDWVGPILIEQYVVPSWTLGVGTGPYQDLSNNQPISLKISPYDKSVHICYQKYNGTEYELKYWTNSTNLRDISGVDSSLNYVGLHTQGRTLDISNSYVEAYWDLSSAKCIFSRDYTRYDETNKKNTGWIPSVADNQWQIKRYKKPFGGRGGYLTNNTYDNPIIYKAVYFDKIYMITRVKTPSSWGTYEDLFCFGGYTANTGAYFAGAYNGSPFFGTQSNYQSSEPIKTTLDSVGGIPYKNGGSQITSNFVLATNRNYELEYYYNKTNYYAFIKVTDLSGQTAPTTDIYEFYNIDVSGGFNMKDGYLSIGSGAHSNSYTEFWTGEIYKMSIYGTDISNIPQFTLTRNGEILDTSGNKYSSFFDNSGNKGLDLEPKINNYQVIDVSNSLNGITCPPDISGNSYVKSTLLHDIYYYQLIPNQTGIATGGQKVVAFDRFEDGTGIWACGWVKDTGGSGKQKPTVWVSFDNGLTWNTKETPSSLYAGNYYTDGEYFWVIKTHIDISGGKWVFVGGWGSLLYASNTYGTNGQVGGKTLGNEWHIIGTLPGSGNGDPSGEYFDRSSSSTPDSGWVPQNGASFFPGWMAICPVDINLDESKAIFNGQDASSNAFHLWVGHWGSSNSTIKDMVLRGNYIDYSNNTLDYSYNIIANTILNENTFDPSGLPWTNESMLSFSFGGVDKGVGTGTIEDKIMDNSGGLSYGIATTDNYVYTTKNGGKTWDKKLATEDRKKLGGDSYPNKWIRGTTGSYVEKNKIYKAGVFVYDNSGMYIQTQSEPWTSQPGFMVADNIGDDGFGNYDLSFDPSNNTNPKTITWDPSLNSNDYWNPLVLDNSGRGINFKIGGGNNYKVYIDNQTSDFGSNPGNKEYKEETWTWDTFQPSTYNYDYWGLSNQGSVLYQKGSEYSQQWKKIEFSPFDISINVLTTNQKFHWESMSPVDLGYSIIHNDVWATSSTSSGVENVSVVPNTYGFFKLSRTPPVANFDVDYTSPQTSVTCLLKYKDNFWVSIDRLNLDKLDIETKWYLRKVTTPESSWTRFGDNVLKNYNPIFSGLQRGYSYEFYVVLSNKYGEGWSSAISDPISIPSPDPAIYDVTRTIKLFENKIQWKPYIETDNVTGTLVKSVYAYDITKQYWDNSQNNIGQWVKDEAFCNAYTDISGQIIQTQWNGINGDISTNIYSTGLVTDATLIDTDISLNNVYKYGITPKGSGLFTPASPSYVTTMIDNGIPNNIKYEYFSNDASFNICWNKYQDISTNTTVTWDISWQEIRKEAPPGGTVTDNSGIYVYNDPSGASSYGTGKNYTRITGLPLPDKHLFADASYNFQIKGRYKNMSNNVQFDTSYNLLYDTNGQKTLPYTYWNQQQIPVLNDIIYNTSTDIIDINWNATTIPDTPYYYDISLSNVTDNRSDYSYNIIVTNGNKLPDISNNGLLYYPGEYNVRVKAAYGNSVPVETSLFSEWSNSKSFSVPTHLPTNFKVTAYNSNNIEDITNVSYVKLTWDPPGKAISNNIEDYPQLESYSLIRKTANKGYNYIIDYSNNNIDKTLDSFVDNNYPLGLTNTVPRIYRYDLSANYL